MLKLEDIEVQIGRAVGGDVMKIVHKPTGVFRTIGPPLKKPGSAKADMLREIEIELKQRGLTQHIR